MNQAKPAKRRAGKSLPLPDWDSIAKHYDWSRCPAVEFRRHGDRSPVFRGTDVSVDHFFRTTDGVPSIRSFLAGEQVKPELVEAVIDFALQHDPRPI